MHRANRRRFILPITLIIVLFSFSIGATSSIRRLSFRVFSPIWKVASNVKSAPVHSLSEAQIALQQENLRLKEELAALREWILFEDRIQAEADRFTALSKPVEGSDYWKAYFTKRSSLIRNSIESELSAIPARVSFRSQENWSHSLWISLGTCDNIALGREVIAKNSPVIYGTAVVGLVEEVGRNHSRVRLVTDPNLKLSVCKMDSSTETLRFTRRGEVCGSRKYKQRRSSETLSAIGYFSEEEEPFAPGDLLVTTGLDGVFPACLEVATVMHVNAVSEGCSTYEFSAKPSVSCLNALRNVYVLPARNKSLTIE